MKSVKKKTAKEGKKNYPLKIKGDFNEVLKIAVKGNPKPNKKKR